MSELPYDAVAIESKWQAAWDAAGLATCDLTDGPVFYNLAEFPYPSAQGLHVGHVFKYSGLDAYGRYHRMRGHNVFQPMGFDAFGINAENYALKAGEHPKGLIARTTVNFRRQLSLFGCAWDWSRVLDTSDPTYYRWTQWVLVKLFRAGLMYQADARVQWCPSCLTVLAREQIEAERCERCGTEVVERVMRQWFLRITAYADRLLDGLDSLDWPERAKRLQRAWIGRSVDGEIDFGDPDGVAVSDAPLLSDGQTQRVGRPAHRYRMRDWLISRQRYWGPPIPIVHCASCGAVPVPEDQLPVALPDIVDFRPTGTGVSPLAAVEEWVRTACPACGGDARRETDVSDTFVDSAWYFLRYPSTDVADAPWDPVRTADVGPVDFYAGGPEHVQRHHLYARFVTMALHDLGLLPFAEPFPHVRLGGIIVHDGAKMSKSRGNVVNPDDYFARCGGDVLRCALLFSAPWDEGGEFQDTAIAGVERFFARAWRVVDAIDAADDEGFVVDRLVRDVGHAIERLRCNVAIARLMEALPHVHAAASKRVFVRLLAPLAPYLAEELWHRLDGEFSVHSQPWPEHDEAALRRDIVTIAVQVDGKTRARIDVPAGTSRDEARAAAMARVADIVDGRVVARVVYVPDRVVNLVLTG